jgi:hypothetical protein
MGYSLGTAIVEYESSSGAKKAVSEYNSKNILNLDAEIDGRQIRVKFANFSFRRKRLGIRKRRMNKD